MADETEVKEENSAPQQVNVELTGRSTQAFTALDGLVDTQEFVGDISELNVDINEKLGNSQEKSQTGLFDGVANPPVETTGTESSTEEAAKTETTAETTETDTGAKNEGVVETAQTPEQAFAEIDDPLAGKIKIGAPNEAAESSVEEKFENIESINKFLKEKHGIDDVNNIGSYIEELEGKSSEFETLSVKHSNVENLFKTMPQELHQAIQNWTDNKDWKGSLNSVSIDFTKEANDIEDKKLVEAMMPGKITAEDWDEYNDEDGDPTIKRLVSTNIEISKGLFDSKKTSIKAEVAGRVESARVNQEMIGESINKSKESFQGKYTNADAKTVGDIEQVFSSERGLYDLFYDGSGALKEDAFLKVAMAMHGDGLIEKYKTIAHRKIETETTQNILATGAETVNASKGSASTSKAGEVRPEVQARLNSIEELY